MAADLQRELEGVWAEKTDVIAALAAVGMLQDEAAAGAGPSSKGAPVPGSEASAGALAWAAGVCRGAAPPPPGPAASLPEDARSALRWARYAAAAYGARGLLWCRGKTGALKARRELSALAKQTKAGGEAPLAGWAALGGPAAPKGSTLQDFAAARETLGGGTAIVALSPGDKKAGLLPHVLAVDRCADRGWRRGPRPRGRRRLAQRHAAQLKLLVAARRDHCCAPCGAARRDFLHFLSYPMPPQREQGCGAWAGGRLGAAAALGRYGASTTGLGSGRGRRRVGARAEPGGGAVPAGGA